MIKNTIVINIDKDNYKFNIKYKTNNKINNAVIRVFTDYNRIDGNCGCVIETQQKYDLCGNLIIEPNIHNLINYIDYIAIENNTTKKELTFVLDKKILELKPARYISSLIIDNKCCQEIILDTFYSCPEIFSFTTEKTDLGVDIC